MLKFTHEYYRHVQRKYCQSQQELLFHRDRCFIAFSINNREVGCVEVQLYSSELPLTCENFRALCTGEKGAGRIWKKPLHYKGSPIHRIVPKFVLQGGDFSHGDGRGGESVHGETFEDEGFQHRHVGPGLLSMANRGPNTNGSQFFITLAPAPHLDGSHVVFGEVTKGMEIIRLIEQIETSENNRPKMPVKISDCGMVPVQSAGEEDLPEEELVQREEKAQAEVTERLAGSVTESVQAALAVHGRKREPPDRPAPRPAKALKTSGMLRVDAAVDTSDGDD